MKNIAKHSLSALGLIFFIIIAFGTGDEKSTQKEISNKEPAVEITAQKLYSEYEANGVSADQKYKNKVIRVTGTVNSINRDILDKIYVTLKGNDVIGDVQCFFAEDHVNAAANLSKGEKITVKGKCDGKMMNVMLKGCIIE